MDVWTAIKKGMIFIILSIFILMLVSLIPTQLLTRTEEVSTQNPSTLLPVSYKHLTLPTILRV